MPSRRSSSRCAVVCLVLSITALYVQPVFGQTAETPFRTLLEEAQAQTKKGEHAAAASLWQRVVKANPTNAQYWLDLSRALYRAKQYREAIPALEKCIELRADYPQNAMYDIARCHALLGDKDQALQWLDRALQRGYRDLTNARTNEAFTSLRDYPKYQELVARVDTTKMSRDEGWRYDLKLLAREIKRLHYNPYRYTTREQFDGFVTKLHDDIPKMKDNEIMVGLIKLAQMAGDGHTHIRPPGPRRALPIQLFQFEEGLFVTAAAPEHADLAGAEILKVGEHKTADALAALACVISRDNDMGVKAMGATLLTYPRLLNGLGLIPGADKMTLTVRDAAGKERLVTLTESSDKANDKWITARKDAKLTAPLYLKNRDLPYWFEYLSDSKSVYFQYNAVRNGPKETLQAFCGRLFKFIDDNDVDRLIIDIRWNGGGNSFLNKPIVHGLIRCDKINQRGKLFVITGRNTFSAAQNCTTDIETHTNALFVGEPTGSGPSFIGESVRVTLPYSKMEGSISDLLWQRSWPMDYRTWIGPQLYAPPTFALYRANRDPALEAIMGYDQVPKTGNN